MIQDIGQRKFDNTFRNVKPERDDRVMIFSGSARNNDKVLMRTDESGAIDFPRAGECEYEVECTYLFSIDDERFFLIRQEQEAVASKLIEKGYTFEGIRALRRSTPQYLCFAGMTAYHLFAWYRDVKFCGRCGKMLVHDDKQRMMKCEACTTMFFPKIAPAVIIGLKKDDSIMISRYAGREHKGRALLAGFCEIGETPEETVAREVYEEVGLKVKNIEYYGSQPWGFDSNLLLGYFCELEGADDITMDTEELAEAGFVQRDDIEYEENMMSLTATMIEAFRTGEVK